MATTARRSLRAVIITLTFGLLLGGVLLAVVAMVAQRQVSQRRLAGFERANSIRWTVGALLGSLVDQEVGLRGYLASGDLAFLEPLRAGETEERLLRSRLWVDLEHLGGVDALDLVKAIDIWHRTIAGPQIEQRTHALVDIPAALALGKTAFDQIRHEATAILEATNRRADVAEAATHRIERWIYGSVGALSFAVLLIALLGTRYVLRHTVRPLVMLANQAEQRARFEDPHDDAPVREVHALASALASLDRAVRVREDELSALHAEAVAVTRFGEFAQQLAEESELHVSLERVLTTVVGVSTVHLALRNASKNHMPIVLPSVEADQPEFPGLLDPLQCRAVRTLREVSDTSDSPTRCRCPFGVPQTGSYACLPMFAGGELVGVCNLQSPERDHFTAQRIGKAQAYSRIAGTTVSTLRLLAATRERALRDALTGVHNRAFLAEYLPKMTASARRRSADLAVLMVDLDHFKRINDQYGHPVGDEAVIALARCLEAQTRSSDAVIRYGGEEFLVVLTDVTPEGAAQVAERIRLAIEETQFTHAGVRYPALLRASIGLALLTPHRADHHALVAAADAALYRAKQAGRNRVTLAA